LEKAGGLLGKPVAGMSAAERWAAFFRYAGDSGRRELVNGLRRA
jgi:hypothetical protein